MPKIKICGLTRPEDIAYVNKYMPEYIGFIFAESKRRVTLCLAKALSSMLDQRIKKVGVFVNESIENIVNTSLQCQLDVIQLHGDESPEFIIELRKNFKNITIWKAFRVKDTDSISNMGDYDADAFVLDAYVEGAYGGAGKTFDWNVAREASKYGKIVLAGGLDTFNAWKAIEVINPYILDISSGVETNGYKDESKIREFINTVRSYG